MSEEEQHTFAQCLLFIATQLSFVSEERIAKAFDGAQTFGAHFMPVSPYSPVPDTAKLTERIWDADYSDLPNLGINEQKIVAFLDSLTPYARELSDVPRDYAAGVYYWNCGMFNGGDASLLYGIFRKHKPRRVIEIGCGYSTLMGLRAMRKNGCGGYVCIDPSPNKDIEALAATGDIELIRLPVQEVSIDLFRTLSANDILFIDSTHAVRIGSDAVYALLKVIPTVSPGVLIHLHDIFFPHEMPRDWVMDKHIFWTEQYLLTAFLAFNSHFEMLIPNYACDRACARGALIQAAVKAFPYSPILGGGSFWLRRVS